MDLKYIHAATTDILKEIDKLCKKHNISYFLMYGTLLGAVRHKGFIPWDDDLDICMLRDDYEKFLKIAAKELPAQFSLCESRCNPHYTNIFAKVFDTNTRYSSEYLFGNLGYKGLWVDILPLDFVNAENEEEAYKKANKRQKLSTFFRIIFENRYSIHPELSGKMRLICKVCRILPANFWLGIINKIFYADKRKNSKYCVDYNENTRKKIFEASNFTTTKDAIFSGEYFPVPHNTEELLTKIYGNYLELPPEEKRLPSHDLFLNEEN